MPSRSDLLGFRDLTRVEVPNHLVREEPALAGETCEDSLCGWVEAGRG